MTEAVFHPSNDDLVLLFYGELTGDERVRVSEHVDDCAACRAGMSELAAVLHLAGTYRAPEPDAGFENAMWTRLQPHLRLRRLWATRHVVALGAWAAAIGAIVVGTHSVARHSPTAPPTRLAVAIPATRDADVQERVLLTAVDSHLAQAEMLFVELMNAPADSSDAFAYARVAADDLVSSGRLYREAARDTGDASVADVLDDLETVLVEVARTNDQQDHRALRDRIEDDGLLFKVRAVSHEIRNRESRMTAGEGAL